MRLPPPVDMEVVKTCPRTGRVLSSRAYKGTGVTYALTDDDKRLIALGRDAKAQAEFLIEGSVQMHTRLAREGKATLILARRNLSLMLRTADAAALMRWLSCLSSGGAPAPGPIKRSLVPSSASKANIADRPDEYKRRPSDCFLEPSHSPLPPHSAPTPPLQLSPASDQRLTHEQKLVLKQVLGGRSLFFTGGAGVGKSFLLK